MSLNADVVPKLLVELDAKTKEEELQANIAEMKEKIASLQEKFSKEELSKLVRIIHWCSLSPKESLIKFGFFLLIIITRMQLRTTKEKRKVELQLKSLEILSEESLTKRMKR